jgi:hypothetical protein
MRRDAGARLSLTDAHEDPVELREARALAARIAPALEALTIAAARATSAPSLAIAHLYLARASITEALNLATREE